MGLNLFPYGFESFGSHTESSGTAIEDGIPGGSGRAAVVFLSYTGGGTAHTLSFLYAEGTGSRNTADGDAASGQKDVTVTDTPKDPAGNAAATDDNVAYELADGTWEFNTVSSVSSNTITLNNNISAPGINDGAKVNIIGVQGDGAEIQLEALASSNKEWGGDYPVVVAPYREEPLYFYSPNGTNAGTRENMLVSYINK
jgi:hypothetical protein